MPRLMVESARTGVRSCFGFNGALLWIRSDPDDTRRTGAAGDITFCKSARAARAQLAESPRSRQSLPAPPPLGRSSRWTTGTSASPWIATARRRRRRWSRRRRPPLPPEFRSHPRAGGGFGSPAQHRTVCAAQGDGGPHQLPPAPRSGERPAQALRVRHGRRGEAAPRRRLQGEDRDPRRDRRAAPGRVRPPGRLAGRARGARTASRARCTTPGASRTAARGWTTPRTTAPPSRALGVGAEGVPDSHPAKPALAHLAPAARPLPLEPGWTLAGKEREPCRSGKPERDQEEAAFAAAATPSGARRRLEPAASASATAAPKREPPAPGTPTHCWTNGDDAAALRGRARRGRGVREGGGGRAQEPSRRVLGASRRGRGRGEGGGGGDGDGDGSRATPRRRGRGADAESGGAKGALRGGGAGARRGVDATVPFPQEDGAKPRVNIDIAV